MFKNEFQGGSHFEVFSAQGKDPTGVWKLQGGSGIRKVYEKEVKSFVYTLEGTVATTKMQLPKDPKQSCSLVQRYVIFQLNVPKGAEFSVEIGITDIGNNKRRLNLSTSARESITTPLHAKMPLTVLKKSVWVNCCIDMVNVVGETWPGQTFGKIDSITISANCKLRRIFTMKNQPPDTTDDDSIYGVPESQSAETDQIPRAFQLHADVQQYNQLINMHKIRHSDLRVRTERPSMLDLDLNASGRRSQTISDSFHIAFGTKVGKPPTAVVGRKSTTSALPSGREHNMRSSALLRDSTDHTHSHTVRAEKLSQPGARQRLLSDPGNAPDAYRNNPLNQSRSWSGAEMQERKQQEGVVKPHPPPRDLSADKHGRRRPKIRSGDKHRTPADAHLHEPTGTSNHHHTVSAPPMTLAPKQSQEPRLANSHNIEGHRDSRLSPVLSRPNKLAPLDRRKPVQSVLEPKEHRSKTLLPLENKPRQPEELNGHLAKPDHRKNSLHDDMDQDTKDLIDSLEKFTGVAHSDSEEDSSSQELFHFRSPPKAAAKPLPKPDTAAKRHLNRYHNDSINHWSQHANNDYTPSKYSKPETSPTRQLNPIEAKPPRAQVSDIMQPRPPDSPSPRPGSGRLRSRNNSRANSRNNSNKPTPESSGTGEDLCGHLTTDTVKDSPRRKPLMAGEEFDGVPSPRTSDKGPRISSGNSASRASASSVESSNSDRLQPPNANRRSERGSPVSSRGSTRLSRKALREIPDGDKRLINVVHSSSPNQSYEAKKYQMVDDTFDEEHMLQYLRREQECGSSMMEDGRVTSHTNRSDHRKHYEHEVSISEDGDHSSDESFMTTSVPMVGAHDYKEEMLDTLDRSDPRDISMFSPPIVYLNQEAGDLNWSQNLISTTGPTQTRKPSNVSDDEEQLLDLVYDPELNAYYDPKSHKYYELK